MYMTNIQQVNLAVAMDTTVLIVILQIFTGLCTAVTKECFFKSVPYKGHVRTSSNNRPCRFWSDVLTSSDQLTSRFPDNGLVEASNFCRDPNGKGHPWCYVWLTPNLEGWKYCNIPYCQECYYPGQTQDFSGQVTYTGGNSTCDRWQDVNGTAVTFNSSQFPGRSIVESHNYCRDPFNRAHLYCSVNETLVPCHVPKCPGPCKDDDILDCTNLAATTDMCRDEYFSTILCAKTCGKCGFGLLPPTHRDPPIETCIDNPDVNCEFMQRIICPDPDIAQELCPRTCGLCATDTTASPTIVSSTTVDTNTSGNSSSAHGTTLSPNEQCEDSREVNCAAASIKEIVCPNEEYSRHFCRKTCGKCDSVAVNVTRNSCGDPVDINMCPFLNKELCLCDDPDLRPALCPHYCAGDCGPVDFGTDCGHPGLVG